MYLDAINRHWDISTHEQNFLGRVTDVYSEYSSSVNSALSGDEEKTSRRWSFHHMLTEQLTETRCCYKQLLRKGKGTGTAAWHIF